MKQLSTSSKPDLMQCLLLCLVFASAFACIYLADYNRRLLIQAQQLSLQQQALTTLHDQLLLEQSTLTTQARIEAIANQKLHMRLPNPNAIVIIQLPKVPS